MTIDISADGIEYQEDDQDCIIINPSNSKKEILIRSLIELINYFKIKS